MRFLVLALLFVLAATHLSAQDKPKVSVEFEETETLVGQPLVLRIKVLVSTWLPQPPEFPGLEVPGLMVRLPERASSPTSETIDGETWSGVQRAYRLYPLQPGDFTIPAQEIRITVADPGKTDPIIVTEPTPEITFRAKMPDTARDLNPPVLANGFTLEQDVEGGTDLAPGDAVTRTVTAQIDGTTAILIPQITPTVETGVVRSYPTDPAVSETSDRGVLSGQRVEKTTYVAQADGTTTLPEIAIDWFNIESGAVETATLPGTTLTVTGAAPADGALTDLDPRRIGILLAVVVVLLLILWRALPVLKRLVERLKADWRASEGHASREVVKAIRARDLSQVHFALANWSEFFPDLTAEDQSNLDTALTDIGRSRYGSAPGTVAQLAWSKTGSAFTDLRKRARRKRSTDTKANALPPLNAGGTSAP